MSSPRGQTHEPRGRGRGRLGGDGTPSPSQPGATAARDGSSDLKPRDGCSDRQSSLRLAGKGRGRARKPEMQLYIPRGRREREQAESNQTQPLVRSDNDQNTRSQDTLDTHDVEPKIMDQSRENECLHEGGSGGPVQRPEQTKSKKGSRTAKNNTRHRDENSGASSSSKRSKAEVSLYVPRPRRTAEEEKTCTDHQSNKEPAHGKKNGNESNGIEPNLHEVSDYQGLPQKATPVVTHDSSAFHVPEKPAEEVSQNSNRLTDFYEASTQNETLTVGVSHCELEVQDEGLISTQSTHSHSESEKNVDNTRGRTCSKSPPLFEDDCVCITSVEFVPSSDNTNSPPAVENKQLDSAASVGLEGAESTDDLQQVASVVQEMETQEHTLSSLPQQEQKKASALSSAAEQTSQITAAQFFAMGLDLSQADSPQNCKPTSLDVSDRAGENIAYSQMETECNVREVEAENVVVAKQENAFSMSESYQDNQQEKEAVEESDCRSEQHAFAQDSPHSEPTFEEKPATDDVTVPGDSGDAALSNDTASKCDNLLLVAEQSMTGGDKQERAEKEGEEEENSWDKIFDDNGDCLDPSMMAELTVHVGEVKISKPKKINYLDYQPKEADMDFAAYGHAIEISDFPAEFQTRDLLTAFKDYMSKGFDIKWVDDTHALGVFSSSIAAQDALKMVHPMMKLRPLSEASKQARNKARRCQEFLQPYKARPETTAVAARRLVAGALGMTTRISKEQRDQERKQLREAKEKKKLDRKQKEAVWDGTFGKCAMDG